MTEIIVVGAGIIGSTIAFDLARNGFVVLLVDADDVSLQASQGSLAWINASSTADEAYFKLRQMAVSKWQEICKDYPDCPIEFPGTYIWGNDPKKTHQHGQRLLGFGADRLNILEGPEVPSKLQDLESNLTLISVEGEGRADPAHLTAWMKAKAVDQGVVLLADTVVRFSETTITTENSGEFSADAVIFAAGNGTPALLEKLGVSLPMTESPGVLFRTTPVPQLSDKVLATPKLDLWQAKDGRVLITSSLNDVTAKEIERAKTAVLADLGELFPDIPFEIEETVQRNRPMPKDGFPLVGPVTGHAGLWCAVAHSGVTLAPIISAEFVELMQGKTGFLDLYSLDRDLLLKEEYPF